MEHLQAEIIHLTPRMLSREGDTIAERLLNTEIEAPNQEQTTEMEYLKFAIEKIGLKKLAYCLILSEAEVNLRKSNLVPNCEAAIPYTFEKSRSELVPSGDQASIAEEAERNLGDAEVVQGYWDEF